MRALAAIVVLASTVASHAATIGETDRYIPLVHDGDGWTTELTIVNLGRKATLVQAAFLHARAVQEIWGVNLTASAGKVTRNVVEAAIPPGGSLRVETSGSPGQLTRGYVRVDSLSGEPIGGSAVVTQRRAGVVTQSFAIPLSPESERKSTVPLRLYDDTKAEFVFIAEDALALLNLTFRDESGKTVYEDIVQFDRDIQIFVSPSTLWPQLVGFKGTMEWSVSFPYAGLYDNRILAGIALVYRGDANPAIIPGMTLAANQLKSLPY